MKVITICFKFFIFGLLASVLGSAFGSDLYYVKFKDSRMGSFYSKEQLKDLKNVDYIEAPSLIQVEPGVSVNDYLEDPDFEEMDFIGIDQVIHKNQWHLDSESKYNVRAQEGWNFSKGNEEIVVAVIDSGIDYNHPELINNIWINKNEIPDNGIDDDNNGFIDDVKGWDFAYNDNKPFDRASHGTHVSGIIASKGIKISGVAPKIKIMPLRFLGANGSGYTSDAIKAMNYAIDNGANIINNSWGGGNGFSNALKEVIKKARDKGIIVITSAGNSGINVDSSKNYRESYQIENVVAVSSIYPSGKLAGSSNYGKTSVTLAAPGVSIYSTMPGGGYGHKSGTSMAAPVVSGAVAIYKSFYPEATPSEIKKKLSQGVSKISDLDNKVIAKGSLHIGHLLEGTTPEDPEEPEIDYSNISVNVKDYKYRGKYRYRLKVYGKKDTRREIENVEYVIGLAKFYTDKGLRFSIKADSLTKVSKISYKITFKDGYILNGEKNL